jgi:hypothetical protein
MLGILMWYLLLIQPDEKLRDVLSGACWFVALYLASIAALAAIVFTSQIRPLAC